MVYWRGAPSFNDLAKWEKQLLINPLLEVIKDFYKCEKNRKQYEEWQRKRKTALCCSAKQDEGLLSDSTSIIHE